MTNVIKKTAVALMVLAASGSALAQGGMKSKGGEQPLRGLYTQMLELDLTDGQRTDLKALMAEAKAKKGGRDGKKGGRGENKPTDAERAERQSEQAAQKAQMEALMNAAQFDEAQAREVIASKTEKQTAKQVKGLQLRHSMMQILTTEQRTALAEQKAAKREARAERKSERQGSQA